MAAPPMRPPVPHRRPINLTVTRVAEEGREPAALDSLPHGNAADSTSISISPTRRNSMSAPVPQPPPTAYRSQRSVSSRLVWADDVGGPTKPVATRPVSAGSGLAGAGYSARVSGGSPNLNAAAAALAERQGGAEGLTSMRPCCRTGGGGRDSGGPPPSNIGGCRVDTEGLSEELRRVKAALTACQEQNRLLRTERQRLEDELGRCRTSLIRAEERDNYLPGSAPVGPTALVTRLREQMANQAAQTELLRAQLDELMRGTRATRVAELQAQVRATEMELCRQSELVALMRRRMMRAESRAEAVGLEAERLARLQLPLAALQQAINLTEMKYAGNSTVGPGTIVPAVSPADTANATAATVAAAHNPSKIFANGDSATVMRATGNKRDIPGGAGSENSSSSAGGTVSTSTTLSAGDRNRDHGGGGGIEKDGTLGREGANGSGKGTADDGGGGDAAKGRAAAATSGGGASTGAVLDAPSGGSQAGPGTASSPKPVAGPQSLSLNRVRKTMAALADAHQIILSQASVLSEVFAPGLTMEQLSLRSALRPATSGAPDVLRYLRYHMHRLVDVLSPLPGSQVDFLPEDDSGSGGRGAWASPSLRRARNNRSAQTSGGGAGSGGSQAARVTAKGSQSVCGGGDSALSGAEGGSVNACPDEECDPWALLGDMLDFVRWMRGLDCKSVRARPELEGGLEQLANVVDICSAEARRLLAGPDADGP